MNDLFDHMGRALYENVLARDEYVLTTFTMANAWKFFMECAEKYSNIKSCVLDIEVKGEWFRISQLMLDSTGMPVYANPKECVGRVVKSKKLENDVVNFMKGEHRQVMKAPY